jgi:hypothetical protein
MTVSGKTIKLYLVDGSPDGMKTAEIMNWSGKVLVAPRAQLAKLGQREEARRTGTYLLIGADPESRDRPKVYIGESDNVLARLSQHDKDPLNEFCTDLVLLISKDNNLTKAHARFLEHQLIRRANASGRATVANGNDGSPVSLPESDVADMESFLEHVQMILPVLGFDFTQPKVDVASAEKSGGAGDISPVFTLSVAGAKGRMRQIGSNFLLLKGSTGRKEGVTSWVSFKVLRDELVASGKLVPSSADPLFYEAAEDIELKSPSAAAAIVAARDTNGRQSWKLEGTGETYQAWFEKTFPTDVS